jgi:ankyrin repeat protein
MRASFLSACAAVLIASSCHAAVAADTGVCARPPAALESWKASLARQLRNHDPSHAAQLSKVTSAIIDGQYDAVVAAINAGLDPNTSLKLGGGGMSLLDLAVAACQEKIAEELVRLGASADGNEFSTPLVEAAGDGESALAEFLIQHGASVHKVDADGRTALEAAVRQHALGATQVLLKHGANPNHPLPGGATIIDLVSGSSNPKDQAIAEALRARGGVSGLQAKPQR